MNTTFNLEVERFDVIKVLPNAWSLQDYKSILEVFDFDDIGSISDSELEEMCLMAISDNEPNEATEKLLEYVFKDQLNNGQRDNLSFEMQDEKVWEEYADLSMHESFFNVGQLLYKAFNGKFPKPEAVEFVVTISTKKAESLKILNTNRESQLVKLIAQGLPENSVFNRLFKTQLQEDIFEEAKDIIWQVSSESKSDNSCSFTIISSTYWFKDYKYTEAYDAVLKTDVSS